MNAVLLCPGPSLARLKSLPECGISLAVNRAATLFAVDWFCASDYPMIRDYGPKVLGRPSLLTIRQTAHDLRNRLDRFRSVKVAEDVLAGYGSPLKHHKTAMLALLFAAWCGASTITVYGADWQGRTDFDGVNAGENRSDARWDEERREWELMLIPWLAERGVKVERNEP